MQISFHGAAGDVTGSCHLITCAGRKILVDCGMFQGGRELDAQNDDDFGFNPASIDVLLLTHAHLDHCGRIPLLVKRGFKGEIVATDATRDLARVVLLDAAHLQEEETRRKQRHGHDDAQPLYDSMDALDSIDRFGRMGSYGKPIALFGGATATFHDAGHILGSASILLELTENGQSRKVLFSGDIGPRERPFLNPPSPPSSADIVVMESTYGDRDHRSLSASVAELWEAISDAQDRGGNVIIPTFALERAQELLFYLREGEASGKINKRTRVFLDSPMAVSATQIYRRHAEALRPDVGAMLRAGTDPFDLPGLKFTRDSAESMALNRIDSGAVIMAGSGMCTGGRVRHHLRHTLSRADCSVIFVGFAAEGTLARIIVDGAQSVKLFGQQVPVRARIHTINGFSAHAGQSDLLDWHHRAGSPKRTYIVHGEASGAMSALQAALAKRGVDAQCPKLHETINLA